MCTASALYSLSTTGLPTLVAGHKTLTGFEDGDGSDARFDSPNGIAVDNDNNVIIADTENHVLRKVTTSGFVSTLAGTGEAGFVDGPLDEARFCEPWGILVDSKGTIFVSDSENNCIRKVTSGEVTTIAGDGEEDGDFADNDEEDPDDEDLGSIARFKYPRGIALDSCGNLIVVDLGNHCIRKVTTAQEREGIVTTVEGIVTTVAGNGEEGAGFADGEAALARFDSPYDIAVDGDNNLLIADCRNHRIRLIASGSARVTTLVGRAPGCVDGPLEDARFKQPFALVLDERGRMLVAEAGNTSTVRVVEAMLTPCRPARSAGETKT